MHVVQLYLSLHIFQNCCCLVYVIKLDRKFVNVGLDRKSHRKQINMHFLYQIRKQVPLQIILFNVDMAHSII